MTVGSDQRIKLRCKNCEARMVVPATAAGRSVRCPKCQAKQRVPAPVPAVEAAAPEDPASDDLFQQLADGEAVEDAPEERAARIAAAGPTCPSCGTVMKPGVAVCGMCGHGGRTEAKPAPQERKSRSLPRLDFAAAFDKRWASFWLVLMLVGVGVIVKGVRETGLNATSSAVPQEITCAQLAEEGPGDNAHILLTEFLLCDSYVYETGRLGGWSRAWVPAVPLGGPYHQRLIELAGSDGVIEGKTPLPRNIKVIVEFPDATDEEYLVAMGKADVIHGTIINLIKELDPETKKLIDKSYRAINSENYWVLVEGRTPGGTVGVGTYVVGGLALIMFGGFMLFRVPS